MKSIKKHIPLLILACLSLTMSCEDLAFGDKFLQKPPSTDVTIDTVFSTAEYARRVLWYSYQRLPYGITTPEGYDYAGMWHGVLEGLTDLNQDYVGYSGLEKIYYPGKYDASLENNPEKTYMATKYRFYGYGAWGSIRHAWLFCENVDRVPDMDATEKARLKAEAKTVIAVQYANMLRHYGGLPIVDHSIKPEDTNLPARSTLQQTIDFIVGLLDEAIACKEFPWVLPIDERENWDGRLTKASAAGLKVRVLLFAASPLFNSDQPYFNGEASTQLMTWFGGYDKNRWKAAVDAGKEFFNLLSQNGYYHLVQKEDVSPSTYRQAFQSAYFDRGTTESLISVRRQYYTTNNLSSLDQGLRWGGFCPTKEYFEMFQMADGTPFDWNNPEHKKNPFINRDPRLNETIILDGDAFQGRTAEVYQALPEDKDNWPAGRDWEVGKLGTKSLATGIACRKFGLDRQGEYNNRPVHWPHLRLAEIYLSHAEALSEYNGGPTSEAYEYVNAVRRRVGLGDLPKGLNQEAFREALLRERACEFGYEEVRFFDLIRWKREDIFTKPLHGLSIYKNKNTGEYKFADQAVRTERAWWKPGGFSPKWYLSAFPSDEINKGYGMVQNPGWE